MSNTNELYTLTGNLAALKRMIAEAENPETVQDLLKDTIEATEDSIGEEIEGLLAMQREYEAEALKFKNEKDFFAAKQSANDKKAETIKKFVAETLKFVGLDHKNKKKIETKFGNVGFQKNAARLEVVDASKIPMEYEIIPEPQYDLKKLLADHKDKVKIVKEVEGAKGKMKKVTEDIDELELPELGIKIVNNESHLRIR
jgi:hypothetical protein